MASAGEKFAYLIMTLLLVGVFAIVGLIGWGFIEIIQWITSK